MNVPPNPSAPIDPPPPPFTLRPVPVDPGRLILAREEPPRERTVVPRRCFPHCLPDRHVALLDVAEDMAALETIDDPARLDPDSRDALAAALARHYHVPEIRRVASVDERRGTAFLDVETDHGPRALRVPSPRENIIEMRPGRFLIVDDAGVHYLIPQWGRLDPDSRRRLSLVMG